MSITSDLRNRPLGSRSRKAENPAVSGMSRRNILPLPIQSPQLSAKERSLLTLEKTSFAITLSLVASALGVYAWSVYIPRLWSQEYQKLETLQRYERHLTAMSESLKNQLAQQAERPEMGLTNLHPAQVIFLSPTSVPSLSQPQKNTVAENKPIIGKTPLAY
jgi:hypothetical protein